MKYIGVLLGIVGLAGLPILLAPYFYHRHDSSTAELEGKACRFLIELSRKNVQHHEAFGRYATSWQDLKTPGTAEVLAAYDAEYEGNENSFRLVLVPKHEKLRRSFHVDNSSVVRFESNGKASSVSPPI